MKYSFLLLIFFTVSCSPNFNKINLNQPYSSKGFAYIYNNKDYENGLIKRKLDNEIIQVAHDSLRPGSLLKIINTRTNDSIIVKINKRFEYPKFYKILMTQKAANELNLSNDFPHVEVFEMKKNKSFIAKKTKVYQEEKKIYSNAPVESVKIDNISKNKNKLKKNQIDKFYIIIAEFYSEKSAFSLKKRISDELQNFNSKKLLIKSQNSNKISLLSGPYNSINLMKNDYIVLSEFGFEELDVSINE